MQASSSVTPIGAALVAGLDRHTTSTPDLRLGELIGSGRHGVVLRAQHSNVDAQMSDVAVKVPSDGQCLDGEAAALNRFSHPHIVRMLDGPLSNGALVLEYCGRGSLAARTNDPLSADEAATVLHQIGGALASIHAEGWIHGDVSLNNIAIRNDGTLALIDFATARTADGEPLTEGTAELAGPRRTARPELDIRCLGAAVLSALADPTVDPAVPVEIRKQRQVLMGVIERSDAGETVELADLFVSLPATTVAIAGRPRRVTGGPDGPSTTEFGPRPGGGGDNEDATSEPRTLNKAGIGVLVALLAVLALASSLFERSNSPVDVDDAVALVEETALLWVTADASLASAGVEWRNGLAVRETASGIATYAVGIPGDLAAVGDWDCNGTATLGVYRPASGSWFVFDSWESSSSSTVRQLDAGMSSVVVEQMPGGCEQPVLG